MVKIETDDLLTVAQAAQERGTTRQAVNHLIRQGKLAVVTVAGKRFISRRKLEAFTPDVGGRPTKKAKGSSK